MDEDEIKVSVLFMDGDEIIYPRVRNYDMCDRSITLHYKHERHRVRIPLVNVKSITFFEEEYEGD